MKDDCFSKYVTLNKIKSHPEKALSIIVLFSSELKLILLAKQESSKDGSDLFLHFRIITSCGNWVYRNEIMPLELSQGECLLHQIKRAHRQIAAAP